MALAELIGKLRTKKRATERTAFQHYLQAVKSLASGEESDADEISHILEVANKSESDLERDVNLQQQRFGWAAQLQANRQAVADRIAAERDVATAQAELQKAYDRLSPAVQAAQDRMRTLEQIAMTTSQAESRLSELILDQELLQREAVVVAKLREVDSELKPLLSDREAKRHSLDNAEFRVEQFRRREGGGHELFGSLSEFFNAGPDLKASKARAADLQDQVRQLAGLIAPRQAEQRRLQNELDLIHQQKLNP